MLKITQDAASQNFVVTVSKFETVKESFKIASQVSRLLSKHGVVSTSTKNGGFEVEFVSYNDNIKADDVLWILVDAFNVGLGYWDYLGIYVETILKQGVVQTNKDGSTIKMTHKNAHKLREDKEFPYNFTGGIQYFEIWCDTVRVDFPSSHESALQIAQELLELLDSLD